MTQQEIQERNKQIALMLGLKPLKKPYEGAFTSNENTFNSFRIFFNGLLEDESWYAYPKFHSDWNWLMEAVEFIQSLPLDKNTYTIFNLPLRTQKELIFKSVSDFAKLYNNKEL